MLPTDQGDQPEHRQEEDWDVDVGSHSFGQEHDSVVQEYTIDLNFVRKHADHYEDIEDDEEASD